MRRREYGYLLARALLRCDHLNLTCCLSSLRKRRRDCLWFGDKTFVGWTHLVGSGEFAHVESGLPTSLCTPSWPLRPECTGPDARARGPLTLSAWAVTPEDSEWAQQDPNLNRTVAGAGTGPWWHVAWTVTE